MDVQPTDILCLILSFLESYELDDCKKVCKRWFYLLRDINVLIQIKPRDFHFLTDSLVKSRVPPNQKTIDFFERKFFCDNYRYVCTFLDCPPKNWSTIRKPDLKDIVEWGENTHCSIFSCTYSEETFRYLYQLSDRHHPIEFERDLFEQFCKHYHRFSTDFFVWILRETIIEISLDGLFCLVKNNFPLDEVKWVINNKEFIRPKSEELKWLKNWWDSRIKWYHWTESYYLQEQEVYDIIFLGLLLEIYDQFPASIKDWPNDLTDFQRKLKALTHFYRRASSYMVKDSFDGLLCALETGFRAEDPRAWKAADLCKRFLKKHTRYHPLEDLTCPKWYRPELHYFKRSGWF